MTPTGSRILLPLRLLLAAATASTLGLALYMARPWGDSFARSGSDWLLLGGFMLWAVSPLAMLAWMAGGFDRTRIAMTLLATGAACIALAGVYAYVDAAVLHPDAQGGLAFVFVPLAQWAVVLCLGGACLAARAWELRR